ncbi:MAG: T9SS type A sorting domain-containing protein [Candidatus Latescibacterota bacterium]|nr:MAG: T9SS type A sorting domain-containing protein [Candidatus Latescibacterota bacterium]
MTINSRSNERVGVMTPPLKPTIVLLLLLCLPSVVFAQYPNVRVSDPGSVDPEEATIAINPTNPLNLVGGANIDYFYYSMDGGLTWQEGQLTSSLGVWGDPVVTFDADGYAYYTHLSWPSPPGEWLDRIVVQKSTDGGVTWSDGVGVGLNPPKEQDKEWIVADITNSPYRNNLYMAWTEFDDYGSSDPGDSTRILFSRSTNSGTVWSAPVRISDVGGNCIDEDETVEGAVPAVGPNGEVYLAWAGPLGIMFDKSLDGGVTFGTDIFVTSQPGGWAFDVPGIYRSNGLPITVCDVSNGPYRGTVYVVWSDQRMGIDDTDVFLIKSTDGGETWGGLRRVNNDPLGAHQFFPWVCVDPVTGIIWVVFYDRRNTSGFGTDVYVARSDDGGETFTNFEISESTFYPTQTIFFGDYINIAAIGGVVHPIWMRMDSGVLSIWTTTINDVTGIDAPIVRAEDIELFQNFPNPFNPTTTISYSLRGETSVKLSIFDPRGRLVTTLVDGPRQAGLNRIMWSGNDARGNPVSSGVYFCRLEASGTVLTKKIMLVR